MWEYYLPPKPETRILFHLLVTWRHLAALSFKFLAELNLEGAHTLLARHLATRRN